MKLTLWQQFSSNHSSLFYVVGEFATRDDAVNARAALLKLHEEGMAAFDDNDAFGETTYGQLVEDQYAIDVPLDAVTFVVGNLLVAQENIDTWTYKAPLEALFEHVQAQSITGYDVKTTADDFETITLEITFTAPDEVTSLQLDAVFRPYFASLEAALVPPPWSDLSDIVAQVTPNSRYLDKDSIARLQRGWDESYRVSQQVGNGTHAQDMRRSLFGLHNAPKSYSRTNLNFHITGVFFVETLGLAGFIAWLEAQGCTDIHLRYV
jgi:hypothetical protein